METEEHPRKAEWKACAERIQAAFLANAAAADDLIQQHEVGLLDLAKPTDCRPGTCGKVEWMTARFAKGLPLHVEGDSLEQFLPPSVPPPMQSEADTEDEVV